MTTGTYIIFLTLYSFIPRLYFLFSHDRILDSLSPLRFSDTDSLFLDSHRFIVFLPYCHTLFLIRCYYSFSPLRSRAVRYLLFLPLLSSRAVAFCSHIIVFSLTYCSLRPLSRYV